jgi:hypothetical protein
LLKFPLALARDAVICTSFLIYQRYRLTNSGITAFIGSIMIVNSPGNVFGYSNVKSLIPATGYINMPGTIINCFAHISKYSLSGVRLQTIE